MYLHLFVWVPIFRYVIRLVKASLPIGRPTYYSKIYNNSLHTQTLKAAYVLRFVSFFSNSSVTILELDSNTQSIRVVAVEFGSISVKQTSIT